MKDHEKFMKDHDYYTALGIYTEMLSLEDIPFRWDFAGHEDV